MDPKENLEQQESLSAALIAILDRFDDHTKLPLPETCTIIAYADRLAELSQAYCEWIKKGGFKS